MASEKATSAGPAVMRFKARAVSQLMVSKVGIFYQSDCGRKKEVFLAVRFWDKGFADRADQARITGDGFKTPLGKNSTGIKG